MATAAQIRDHYDSLTFIYRTFWGDHIHHGLFERGDESAETAQLRMIDHCAELLELRGGERILDAGCGYGGTLLHLGQQRNCCGLGLTLSPKQARIAQEQALKLGFNGTLRFGVENIDTYAFPAEQFDVVWALESSEHFADKRQFLRNAASVLRPAGKLLLAAWTGSMDEPRVREVARAFLCPELWTARQYRAATESAGLHVEQVEVLTTRVMRTWEICQKRVRAAGAVVKLLPASTREFVKGIDTILDAYRSGELSYTVFVGGK